jgi:hypothetical protein
MKIAPIVKDVISAAPAACITSLQRIKKKDLPQGRPKLPTVRDLDLNSKTMKRIKPF